MLDVFLGHANAIAHLEGANQVFQSGVVKNAQRGGRGGITCDRDLQEIADCSAFNDQAAIHIGFADTLFRVQGHPSVGALPDQPDLNLGTRKRAEFVP